MAPDETPLGVTNLPPPDATGALEPICTATKRKGHRAGKKGEKRLVGRWQRTRVGFKPGTTDFACLDLRVAANVLPLACAQLYEIRLSEGRGRGLFALRDIKSGTRVISEESIMDMEPGENNFKCPWRFLKLDPEKQATFLSLQYNEDKEQDGLIREAFLAQEEAGAAGKILPIETQIRIARIYGQYGFKRKDGGTRFCINTKLINHACIPNTDHAWNPDIQRMTVHAVRDIRKGEELFHSYVQPWYPREQRLARLEKQFDFYCTCSACDISTDFGLSSAIRRERLHELVNDLTIHGKRVEEYKNLAFHSQLGFDQYPDDALPKMLEVVQLVEKEGIFDMELMSA
ncbi:uncharacterized protein KY384_004918 [Bacidia gigantensis]|uniref:uncharacterized protein n=1 Tax=Bacidia gigantensis TaxID=2732470 RepID=UPI001D037EA4|nr:uncharacterized protein KY384_004918 [Bacidia gigantensis]KAG8530416.1 hypothetical protein KY384_004918 [Bacidia gigantensis]